MLPSLVNAQNITDSIARSIQLDSVVVNARRPVIKSEGSKDIVSVKGSYLSKMGSLGNMLMVTPGILSLAADYSTISIGSHTCSEELPDGTAQPTIVTTSSHSHYNIATVNASYNFMLPFSIKTQVGARYYNTHHPLSYATDNPLVTANGQRNRQWMDDNVSAGFVSLTRSWAKITANISGRYEYSHTQVKMENAEKISASRRHTSDFLPTAWLMWQPKQNLRFQAYYQRSVSR